MNTKWLWGSIIVGAIAIAFLIFRQNDTGPKQTIRDTGPIVAFGDSLIYGVGASTDQNFVTKLSTKIGEPIVNLGIPGNTTADGLARLNTVVALNPRIVLVLLGGNDYLKRVPPETTFSNLDTIISELRKRDIGVIVLGVQGGVLSDPFEKEFKALTKKHAVAYVPNVLNGLIGKKDLMSDAVHPNAEGYQRIADIVYPVLEKLILGS